ncbi:hypothetical protein TcWFU_007035 [Taenia crassiceps]|uniref:Uncharacterized protein n=1 Tax=Taenia crassiceps TaxID=6207 RepID=A0ABR4PZC3_9CEST
MAAPVSLSARHPATSPLPQSTPLLPRSSVGDFGAYHLREARYHRRRYWSEVCLWHLLVSFWPTPPPTLIPHCHSVCSSSSQLQMVQVGALTGRPIAPSTIAHFSFCIYSRHEVI